MTIPLLLSLVNLLLVPFTLNVLVLFFCTDNDNNARCFFVLTETNTLTKSSFVYIQYFLSVFVCVCVSCINLPLSNYGIKIDFFLQVPFIIVFWAVYSIAMPGNGENVFTEL